MSDDRDEPVHLIQDVETGDRFLVYGSDKGLKLDIRYEGETLWMTQAQIADLFGRDRTSITRHINNVIEEGELDEETSVQKVHKSVGRPVAFYNLDMVISVGYRVSSAQATLFRRWATGILVQFAKKGFVVDSPRHTPAEIIASRADHTAKNMGLQSWPNDNIRKVDAGISKNYLAEAEIKELNRLTNILLDIFDDQLDMGRLVVMQDAHNLLEQQLQQLGRSVLRTGGQISASDAKARADQQYEKFDAQRKLERQQEVDEQIAALAREAKKLPKRPR